MNVPQNSNVLEQGRYTVSFLQENNHFMKIVKNIILFFILLIPTLLVGAYIYATSPVFVLTPHAQKNNTTLLPQETFEIDIPSTFDKKYYQNNIIITPQTPMTATINKDHTKIMIIPKSTWTSGTQYTVSIPAARAKNHIQKISAAQFSFTTPDTPKIIDIKPYDQEKDIRLDIEDPITVQFTHSTHGFYIDFILDPPVPVKYQNNPQKTQFEILPQEPLADNTQYTLTIRAKTLGASNNTFETISSTAFTTLQPKPKTWSEQLQERLSQAQKQTRPQISEGKYIDVNLSSQVMTIFENGKLIDSFLISSGKNGMNTPTGTHQIYNKHPRPWSDQYGLFMPYWMAITSNGKYGIHELPEWPGGYKEGQNHLGIPVSHGCMRLGVGPAQTIYNWAEIGTPVIIYN
jgi:lipoprotein-anchoring transpeptidase ErfK/SrfK